MGTGETTALTLAIVADAIGIVVALGMWRRHRRRRRAVRSRHPSIRPPLAVRIVEDGLGHAVRIDVRPGSSPMTIDFVNVRPVSPPGDWDVDSGGDPVEIGPGGFAILPVDVPDHVHAADVVVAWTAHHPTGDVPGSQLFRLPPERDAPPPPPSRAAALSGRATAVVVVLLALAGVLVATSAIDASDDPSADTSTGVAPDDAASADPVPTTSPVTTTPTTSPPATAATTAPASTTTVVAADPPVTTEAPPTTSTLPVTTSTAPLPPGSPQVSVVARIGACRFGAECLIADFTIEGFDPRPQEYVCEFEDGARFTFRFDSDGVESACSTGSADAAITVEVAGVRSATITRADA